MRIGILNLQGAVSEHFEVMEKTVAKLNINCDVVKVKEAVDVAKCDGIIISGGESTVIGKLIDEKGIDKSIKINQIPVFGTCAGMVLLSKKTDYNQPLLKIIDVATNRNSFGSQVDSFESEIEILDGSITPNKFLGIFIRAPSISKILVDVFNSNEISVIAKFNDKIVAIRQGNYLATAFHPELTNDTRFHEYFLDIVKNNINSINLNIANNSTSNNNTGSNNTNSNNITTTSNNTNSKELMDN